MAVVLTFLLGMGNFAWHSAVLNSGHSMVHDVTAGQRQMIRWSSMALEFILLCAALYAVSSGVAVWFWVYFAYSVINGSAAWLIVSRRV